MEESVLIEFTLEQKGSEESSTEPRILDQDLVAIIQSISLKLPTSTRPDLVDWIRSEVENVESREKFQSFGISCLQLFIQVNWTGRKDVPEDSELVPWLTPELKTVLLEYLIGDGDSSVEVAKLQVLLALSRLVLTECRSYFPGLVSDIWAVRSALTVQSILEEKSNDLFNLLKSIFNDHNSSEIEGRLKIIWYLEEARFHYIYPDIRESTRCTELAAEAAGMKVEDTGALGKRTKFQVRDISQFTLDLDIREDYTKVVESLEPSHLPTDIRLDDEVRLHTIEFKDADRAVTKTLDSLQQSVLISRFFLKKRLLPMDELTTEEIMPHLTVLLSNPVSWSVHVTALFNRCKLESRSSRTVERARAQLEVLLESYLADTPQTVRTKTCYLSMLPPKWEIEKELASVLLSIGSTKAALELYLSLESWDEVIVCYNMLQMRHRSAEIIKTRIEQHETARLWCQLGDATDDLDCYHKALEISKNRNARAFKSLGMHYYFIKEYETSIDYYQKSLVCSRFQLDVLLRLGFAALEIENWAVAAQAYRDYCSLESDNFEAWNNLSKCYIMMKQKERAWRVMQEAVRCDFDNWKVWDNILMISTDLAAFDETLRAFNRILDIKQTHTDDSVLRILTSAVVSGIQNSSGHHFF